MADYIGLMAIGIPCVLFIIFSMTKHGKEWMRRNNMLERNMHVVPHHFGKNKF